LDLGCGGAWTSVFYALRGYCVVGQDIAPDMIKLATENRDRHGLSAEQLSFVCADYERITVSEQFDCAIFFDSLHHADDERAAIKAAYGALKPGGILITHEPGEGHSTNPHSIAAMEQFGVNERDMPPHLIIKHGKEIGFRERRILPIPPDLFNIFYERRYERSRVSLQAFNVMRRMWRIIYSPVMKNSSIVVLTK